MFSSLAPTGGSDDKKQPDGAAGKGHDELGAEDFLKLMITQFQNQDPFEPMESGEFLGQLAHFTSANGITQMKQSFDEFATGMKSDQGLRAANLVGRDVLIESGSGALREGESLSGAVQMLAQIDSPVLRIENAAGEVVREMSLESHADGLAHFSWDGQDDKGKQMAPGTYYLSAQGSRDGETIGLDVLTAARVNSVTLGQGGESPRLSLDGVGDKSLDDVRQIQ